MDEKTAELIKKNKGLLRQLTHLNNEVKELKGRIVELEEIRAFALPYIPYPSKKELAKVNLYEGT